MKRKALILCGVIITVFLTSLLSFNVSAGSIIAPCKMESELDIYAGAYYQQNLRNPVVKGDTFKVVWLEWNVNHYRSDYRESFAYSSSQRIFSENSTYYLRLTLHSLNYPNTVFSSSTNADDFSGFTVSLKVNGEMVELKPHAVDNYDDTHEYIDLIYKIDTKTADNKIGVTGINSYITTILVGNAFVFDTNICVEPINATNQYILWHFLDDFDGGTNYQLVRGRYYLTLEPKEGYTPRPGKITLVAQIPNGKENGGLFATTLTINIVSDISLQGTATIPEEPTVGKEIDVVLDGDVKTMYDVKYIWEFKNSSGMFDPVTKIKNYGTIDNNKLKPGVGLVGKEIRVRITSSKYLGSVVSNSIIVMKNSVMKSPCAFVCGFSSTQGICAVISSDTHLLQEFVLMKSSTPPTEEQWQKLAKYPTSKNDLYFANDENGSAITGSTTYTIYSRFKATESTSAGSEVISSTYYTGFKCQLDVSGIKLVYNNIDYKSYDTIIIDLKGESSVTFKPKIVTTPSNANEWRKHVWKLTGSETVNFYGVGNKNGPYYITLNYQSGNEYYTELKATFTKQGIYYLSADIDGSADRYGYYNIIVIDSTKHIDEYVVSVRPSNITPTSLTVEQNTVYIPSFVSTASIFPTEAQKDYKIIYKEAIYQSGSYGGVPYKIVDNEYIDVDEKTGAITGVKKTGSNSSEKGYMVLCIYDTTTQKTRIVSGFTITVNEATHKHYLTTVSAKAATCTESGFSKSFYVCSCGKWFADSAAKTEIVDHSTCIANELGHNYGDFIYEVEPTHYKDGIIGHYHCSRCKKDFDISKNEINNLVISNSNHKANSSSWEYDNNYHWHNCVVSGCIVVENKSSHTPNSSGDKCSICNAPLKKESDNTSKDTKTSVEETTIIEETTSSIDETTTFEIETSTTEITTTDSSTETTDFVTTSEKETDKNINSDDEIDEPKIKNDSNIIYIVGSIIGLVIATVVIAVIMKSKKQK